jgi:hypothetical protein
MVRLTAGAMSLKASRDPTKYNAIEVGSAISDDVGPQLRECINIHNPIFNEKEYCVGFVIASDPLIKGVMRKKFFAMLYLPSPRPNQSVFLYNKVKDKITKRLWVLPNAATMAELSEMSTVDPKFLTMKQWSDAFFAGKFWEFIRQQHGIDMLSEHEYLNANRQELIKAGCQEVETAPTESFDFSKVAVKQVVDTNIARLD